MESEDKSYLMPGLIMLALVLILIGSFFIVPKITGPKETEPIDKSGFVDRVSELAFANRRQGKPKVGIPYYGADAEDAEEMHEQAMRDWKEQTFGDPDKIVRPTHALGATKRATAMSTLKNYYTAEMQFFAEHMRFTGSKDSLYTNLRDPEPYEIEIYVFDDDSLIILAKGNLDRDEELDIIQVNQSGYMTVLNNDLAK